VRRAGGTGRPLGALIKDDQDLVAELHDLMPSRPVSLIEAQVVAERQATRLLALWCLEEPPVPQFVISHLPGVFVKREAHMPVAGMSFPAPGHWRIVINRDEPTQRQRFTLAHEFKHFLDDPVIHRVHAHVPDRQRTDRAEDLCDYFAACLLMPRSWVKRDWSDGCQHVGELAWRYRVSLEAMSRRLDDLGLAAPDEQTKARRRSRRRRGARA
jgi:hypothetical protein